MTLYMENIYNTMYIQMGKDKSRVLKVAECSRSSFPSQ